jgi:hypothetical protein
MAPHFESHDLRAFFLTQEQNMNIMPVWIQLSRVGLPAKAGTMLGM